MSESSESSAKSKVYLHAHRDWAVPIADVPIFDRCLANWLLRDWAIDRAQDGRIPSARELEEMITGMSAFTTNPRNSLYLHPPREGGSGRA